MKSTTLKNVQKILLICGILSSVLYVVMNIIGAIQFKGYSIFSQSVSELSAIGATSRPLWIAQGIIYGLLIIAFGIGIYISAGRKRTLKIVGILLVIYGLIGLPWMIYAPMHLRGQGFTLTDIMHIVFAMIAVLIMFISMGFGAAAFGNKFRYYSIGTILLLLGFGFLTGLDGPKIAANLPTPFVGIWERINIGVFLLWVVVLAIVLLQKEKETKF